MIVVPFKVRCVRDKTEPVMSAMAAVVAPSRALPDVIHYSAMVDRRLLRPVGAALGIGALAAGVLLGGGCSSPVVSSGVNLEISDVRGVPWDGGSSIRAVPGAQAIITVRAQGYGLGAPRSVTVSWQPAWAGSRPPIPETFQIEPKSRSIRVPGTGSFTLTFPSVLPESPYGWAVRFDGGNTAFLLIDPP